MMIYQLKAQIICQIQSIDSPAQSSLYAVLCLIQLRRSDKVINKQRFVPDWWLSFLNLIVRYGKVTLTNSTKRVETSKTLKLKNTFNSCIATAGAVTTSISSALRAQIKRRPRWTGGKTPCVLTAVRAAGDTWFTSVSHTPEFSLSIISACCSSLPHSG